MYQKYKFIKNDNYNIKKIFKVQNGGFFLSDDSQD